METWPNFFIVGAPKAGTTSLYHYLKIIPEIFMSPIKEPHYFSPQTVPRVHFSAAKIIRNKNEYLELFKKVKDEKIVGEASATYLADPSAATSIHQVSPHALILITLRNPIERAFSYYLHLTRVGALKNSFEEQLEKDLQEEDTYDKPNLGLRHGFYSQYVQKYLDVFGKNQVKILIYEDWIKNTKHTLEEISQFLGVKYTINNFSDEAYNPFAQSRGTTAEYFLKPTMGRKLAYALIPHSGRKFLKRKLILKKVPKPILDEKSRKILANFYFEDVKKLKKILNRELPWPDFVID